MKLGSPQQRSVFAVLAACAGEPVSTSMLCDMLWGQSPPPSAAATVQQYVSRLRRVLSGNGAIRRVPGGYQLTAAEPEVDVLTWRGLVARAREERGRGDDRAAVTAFVEALALWAGPVAADLAPATREHPLFVGMSREHAVALCEAADLALSTGRSSELAPVLQRAATWHRFDEGVQSRLIRVLAVQGQRAEALRCFRAIRQELVGELGIEPGSLLQEAHRSVLAAAGKPLAEPVRPPLPGPATLPVVSRGLSGREAEFERLDALVSGPLPVVVVTGMGGAGKTSLALRWAHHRAGDFPDGRFYLDLRGFAPHGTPMDPTEALHLLLATLGVPRAEQPSTRDGLAALYRSLLADRRALIVLDNAHDDDQVRPLLPGGPGCTVVVTSRSFLGALTVEGARSMGLSVFSETDAFRFLRSRLGHRVDAEPGAAAEVIALCGRLPLAMSICAAWAQRIPSFTLASLAAELRRRDGLDAFAGIMPGRDVRTVFSWSYQRLGPQAAELFRRLGVHPGPDMSATTAAGIAGHDRTRTLTLLTELVDAQLLTEVKPGRYALHDLVRAYAAELSDSAERDETVRRVVDHFLHTLVAGAGLVDPVRLRRDPGPPAPGVIPWSPHDADEALNWFGDEHANLLPVFDAAERAGLDEKLWMLSWSINAFVFEQIWWHDYILKIAPRALASAERCDALWWCGYLHNTLGKIYFHFNDQDRALHHFEQSAAIGRRTNNPLRVVYGLNAMTVTLLELPDWPSDAAIERAAAWAGEARALCEDIIAGTTATQSEDARKEARQLIGDTYQASAFSVLQRTGDVQAAIAELNKGAQAHLESGSGREHSPAWAVARFHRRAGDDAAAVRKYEETLKMHGSRSWSVLECLVNIAECHARLGDAEAVAATKARAQPYFEGSFHNRADEMRARLEALDVPAGGPVRPLG
ncbi:BTAD domain-containing putative transcriptional regulator [Micromonospora andamanensis]|uniref:AfsR/SARP family transcriptional regulator n=1 Tax=Micromonospora andamanensis TaxID=1287068 RepID=UPI00194E4001|nr:BTAD domain-containing putative transcriptional regulator [Micromonospora andamanensis]